MSFASCCGRPWRPAVSRTGRSRTSSASDMARCSGCSTDGWTSASITLVELARILQVHPMEFLELGFPDWPSRHRLTDWMRPDTRIRRNRQALPSTREELADLVRGIVQEELGAREDRPKGRSGLRVIATPEKDRKQP